MRTKKSSGSASPQPKRAVIQPNTTVNVSPKVSRRKKVIHCMEVTVFAWTVFATVATILLILASASIYFSGTSVDHQIVWDPLSQTFPVAEFNLPLVKVSNIRNFSYPTYDEHHAVPQYYNRTYNVDEIKQVYYVLGAYPEIASGAHVWLTFEFENGDAVSISVEARARKGEEVSLVSGLFNKYHLIYQVVDERDIITLRAVLRDNSIYLLPAAKEVGKELFRQVFVEMLERANELRTKTEWYNTIFNSCIMNVVRHVNKIRPHSIPHPFSMDVLLSGNSAKLFYSLGLLDTTKDFSLHPLAFCLLILVPEFVRSEILASSSYPMADANPSRNRQINRKLLCPEVAPGRTQVWNIEWRTVLPDGWFSATELTQDEQGFVYFQAGTYSDPNSKILKINGKDGSYDTNLMYSAPFPRSESIPTHVKGNKMYIAAIEMTTIVNTTSMTDIAVIPHPSYFLQANPTGSYAPLNNDFMVTAHPDQTAVNVLRYLNTSSPAQFDSAQPNFAGVYANNVIIYTNASGIDIPIVVMARAGGYDGTISVWSPNYQFTLPGDLMYDTSYVQNNQLYIQYQSYPGYITTIAIYDPENGELLQTITKDTWNRQSASFANLITFGNKTIGYVYTAGTFNVVDFSNEITLIEGNYLWSRPTYSIPDNSVFLSLRLGTDAFQFISLDWDTNVINAVGSFPTDAYYGDISVSPPMVGDECMLYTYFDDNFQYSRGLLAFKPLRVSDVVPILECINDNGVGYFSYHNLEDKRIIIPYAKDRNNLEPMKIAPAIDFQALQRGKYFPLSSRVTLSSTNSTFTWLLEDYVLSFKNTELLRCPRDVRFVMYFNATNAVPSGFDEWTRKTFVSITGTADSRVTVVAISQVSVPSNFKVSLQITTGSSGQGLIPEQIVQTFAEQQLYRYNQQLATDPTYSLSNITVVYIDGAGPLATEISGINPSQPLTQAPIDQPNTNQPQTNCPSPVNTPKTTSTASLPSLSSGITTLVLTYIIVN